MLMKAYGEEEDVTIAVSGRFPVSHVKDFLLSGRHCVEAVEPVGGGFQWKEVRPSEVCP